jgi:hypothetical protein
VDLQLVQQPRREVLLSDGGASGERDVLGARSGARLLERRGDPPVTKPVSY